MMRVRRSNQYLMGFGRNFSTQDGKCTMAAESMVRKSSGCVKNGCSAATRAFVRESFGMTKFCDELLSRRRHKIVAHPKRRG
jgi:hypothetical protein